MVFVVNRGAEQSVTVTQPPTPPPVIPIGLFHLHASQDAAARAERDPRKAWGARSRHNLKSIVIGLMSAPRPRPSLDADQPCSS